MQPGVKVSLPGPEKRRSWPMTYEHVVASVAKPRQRASTQLALTGKCRKLELFCSLSTTSMMYWRRAA